MVGIYFTCCSYLLIILFILGRGFRLRKSKKTSIVEAVLFGIILGFFTIQKQTYLVRMVCMALYFLFILIAFDIDFLIAVITSIFSVLLIATSEWSVMFINANNLMHFFDSSNINSLSYFFALLLGISFFLIYSIFFSKMLEILKNDNYPKSKWLLLCAPLMTFILVLAIPDYFELVKNHQVVTFSMLGLIFSNFIMLYFYTYSIKAIHLDSELTMIKSKQEYLEEKVQLVNQHYTHSFNYLHRFLHECNDLNYFVETKDMDNIAALAKKMGEEAGKEFNMIYSNSLALNTVLQQKNDKIQELNVSIMTTILCDLKDMELSDQIELYEILLNHAFDNCKQFDVNDRQIRIVLKEINSNIAIQMISPNQDKEDMVENILKDMIKKYSMRYNRKVEEDKEMILLLL